MNPETQNLKVETLEVENQLIKLSVEIPLEMVREEIEHAYLLVGRKAKIKGFRPGKIPRAVLESYFREEAESHAIEHLVEDPMFMMSMKNHLSMNMSGMATA